MTKKLDLNKYSKPDQDKLTRASVTITEKQKIYIESKRVNLSKLVRDFLQSIIDLDRIK